MNRSMYAWAFPLLIGLFITGFCPAGLRDEQVLSYHYVPGKGKLALYWQDDRHRPVGSLGNLERYVRSKGHRLLFAMNGGMYQADQSPVGLFVEQGVKRRSLNTKNGFGNFYLKPNGVFYINSGGHAGVCVSEAFSQQKRVAYATQSGPMLVIDGRIHPAFQEGSANLNIRNGAGILPDGSVLLAMSKEPVNFYDFARYFKDRGCRNALYLDGFVSRACYPAAGFVQTDGRFGVIIAITE